MPAPKFITLETELPDAYPSLISKKDFYRQKNFINRRPGQDTKANAKKPKGNKKASPAKERGGRKGKKPQPTKDSVPKAQVPKQDTLANAGPVECCWPQYQHVALRLEKIQQQQEQEKLSAEGEKDVAQEEKDTAVDEQDVAEQEKESAVDEQKIAHQKNLVEIFRSTKATVWNEDDGVIAYKQNPLLSLASVPDTSSLVSSASSSTYKDSDAESVDFASPETAQAWYDRAAADIIVVVKTAAGGRHAIPLHRDIVSRRCGYIRQEQKTSQPKISVTRIDMEFSEAEACFCFAYTGGQFDPLLVKDDSELSAGQAMLQDCRPNRKDAFDFSSLPHCLRLYGAALKLQMPELCRHLLKQMEALANNMGESACLHRNGVLNSNIWGTSQALEAAMTFMYTHPDQDQWHPMRMAFAGLYDAVALRVGPYLTFPVTAATQQLVVRLHGDHIEYRQLHKSCFPKHGTFVPSLEEMKLTVEGKQPEPLYYNTESHRQVYKDESMVSLSKILSSSNNECETPRSMWD